MNIELIIAVVILILSVIGWAAMAVAFKQVNENNNVERRRYKKAIELAEALNKEQTRLAIDELNRQHTTALDKKYIEGLQEGKKITLRWLKEQQDSGTLEIKVNGTPSQNAIDNMS